MTTTATTLNIRLVTGLVGLVLAVSLAGTAWAQVTIAPGPPGTLNNAINGDTTATGERNNCHYVLQRGAVYIYNATIRLEGDCDWIIEADAGTGARPLIKPAAPTSDEAPRQFQAYQSGSTVTLRNLHLDGYDTAVPAPGRPSDNAQVRASADSIRFIIDGVRFDRNRQSAMRTDNNNTTWYITNSELSNLYNSNRWDQSFGFDTRGNVIDTLVFVNNTFWNLTGRPVQAAGNAEIHYLKMDHNTFVNIGGWPNASGQLDTLRTEPPGEENYGIIDFGQTEYAVFRNNLLVNPGFVGTEDADLFVPRYIVNIDSMVTEIDTVTFDVVPPLGVDIRNNVISYDPDLAGAYPDSVRLYTDADLYDPTMDLFIDAQGTASTLLETSVDLADAPGPPLDFISMVYQIVQDNPDPRPALILPRDTRIPENDPDAEGTLDFSYPTTSEAYSAGVDGLPVGDLNWFDMAAGYTSGPDMFATLPTSNESASGVPQAFTLRGNYPNPSRASTTLEFDLRSPAEVRVAVFDVLGRQVLALPAEALPAGARHRIALDAGALASGIYFYRVEARTAGERLVETGRFLLVK